MYKRQLRDDELYFTERDRDGNEKAPKWIAAPLDILGRSRTPDTHGAATGWGKLCAFADPDGAEPVSYTHLQSDPSRQQDRLILDQ